VAYGNETYRPTIFGMTQYFSKIYGIYPSEGRLFTDEEVKSYADVVLIGSKVNEELFGNESGLDKKIKIKGRNFKVIGVFGQKGQVSFVNFDEIVVVPYTTAQQYIFGIKFYHRIVVEADEEKNVERTVEDIKAAIRASHNITDPEKDDFFVETQADAIEMVGTIMNILKLFLASIAAISLVVGGIGIMNIMLVSVTERTKEIGLRKAVGATNKDILTQFLLESVTLTATGGLVGILLGAFLALVSSLVLSRALATNWAFTFPLSAVFLGIGVSAFVGLIFGIYPARRAARLDPIVALRYE
jgi:putative ABC transport system permease protein